MSERKDRTKAYAQWLIDNQDKAGTKEYVDVANAYRELRTPSHTQNAIAGAVEGAGGLVDAAASGANWVAKKAGGKGFDEYATPVASGVDAAADYLGYPPPDRATPEYLGGNLVGGAVTGGALTGGLKAGVKAVGAVNGVAAKTGAVIGNSAHGLAKEGVAMGGGLAGGMVGQAAGESLGREDGQDVGGVLGAFMGGGVAPAAVKSAAANGAHWMFKRPEGGSRIDRPNTSAEIYDAAMRLGITPSVGLVADKGGQYMENFLGLLPGPGHAVAARQAEQVDALSKAHLGVAMSVKNNNLGLDPRPPFVEATHVPLDGGNPSSKYFPPDHQAWKPAQTYSATVLGPPTEIGRQVRDIAKTGADRSRDTFSRREEALTYGIGANTGVDTSPVRGTINQIKNTQADKKTADVLNQDLSGLDYLNQKWLTQTFPQDASAMSSAQARITELSKQIGQINNMLFENQARGGNQREVVSLNNSKLALEQQIKAEEGNIAQAQANIYASPNAPQSGSMAGYGPLRTWRTNVGMGTDTNVPLERGAKKQIYETTTGQLRQTADQAGLGDEFGNLMTEQNFAYNRDGTLDQGGYLDTADELHMKPTADGAYSWLAGGDKVPHEKFRVLAQLAGAGQEITPGVGGQGIAQAMFDQGVNTPVFRSLLSDFWWDRGRATPGKQDSTRNKFSPQTFVTNYNKTDPEIVSMLENADPDGEWGLRQRIDDTVTAASAMAARGTASNPSGTTALAIPFAMVNGAGGQVLSTLLSGTGLTAAMLNPDVAKVVAKGRDPGSFGRDLRNPPTITGLSNAATYDTRRKLDGSEW